VLVTFRAASVIVTINSPTVVWILFVFISVFIGFSPLLDVTTQCVCPDLSAERNEEAILFVIFANRPGFYVTANG